MHMAAMKLNVNARLKCFDGGFMRAFYRITQALGLDYNWLLLASTSALIPHDL